MVDTRVIYCGDNVDQLRKFPAGCVEDRWAAFVILQVAVLIDQIGGQFFFVALRATVSSRR